ncbi:MAG: hypothetical protein EBU97_02695, partial [Rhodobacteraceae bacterium]|nr:hypothetical protein [Paracoccaceae bacterium]
MGKFCCHTHVTGNLSSAPLQKNRRSVSERVNLMAADGQTQAPNVYDAEPIPEAARAEIDRLLASGDLFRYTAPEGAPVALLEAEFAEMLGSRYALAVSSCSAALFLSLKALDLSVSNGEEASFQRWDGANIATARRAAAGAYASAGITNPREQIHMAEVHDCFSITEAVLMEDLGFSDPGRTVHDILDGAFDRQGRLPVQTDGGLKCFGHPVGASGLRMVYEIYQQLLGRAGERQLGRIDLGLAQNLGGHPHQNV